LGYQHGRAGSLLRVVVWSTLPSIRTDDEVHDGGLLWWGSRFPDRKLAHDYNFAMPQIPDLPSEIVGLADWAPWRPFTAANVATVPPTPGVYIFRSRSGAIAAPGGIVYVGRAAERKGKGVRERLRIYVSGRAPHSGLGNLALERALADADWLRAKLKRVEAGEVITVQDWARDAVSWADLEFSSVSTADGKSAVQLEGATIAALQTHGLWNRRR
jgi:hypothetical protein